MTEKADTLALWHSIADVERDTGLPKDTLRVWERRYGFPMPQRDEHGERRYSEHDLSRLRHLRRLIDAGHRPGQVVALPLEQLMEMGTQSATPRMQTAAAGAATHWQPWIDILRRQDAAALRQALAREVAQNGLARTVTDTVAPLTAHVGQAWLEGRLAIYEEHLFTEVVQQVLRQSIGLIAGSRRQQPPRVLLTTVPGEVHGLGLLMAEAFMALESCETLPLGVQTPLPDIVQAALTSRADVVALSFSVMHNPRDARAALQQLRERLPPAVELWVGGQCPAVLNAARGRARQADLTALPRLQDIPMAVARWRAEVVHP